MHKLLQCTCGSKHKDCVYVVLRFVTGLAFFYHGYVKVFDMGMDQVAMFFSNVGIPAASLFAYLVAYGELIGGLMLMVGFLSHWVAKLNVVILLGAIGFVHFGTPGGWLWGYGAPGGYEYQLLLLVVSVYIMTAGSGKLSVDAHLAKKSAASEPANNQTDATIHNL